EVRSRRAVDVGNLVHVAQGQFGQGIDKQVPGVILGAGRQLKSVENVLRVELIQRVQDHAVVGWQRIGIHDAHRRGCEAEIFVQVHKAEAGQHVELKIGTVASLDHTIKFSPLQSTRQPDRRPTSKSPRGSEGKAAFRAEIVGEEWYSEERI